MRPEGGLITPPHLGTPPAEPAGEVSTSTISGLTFGHDMLLQCT